MGSKKKKRLIARVSCLRVVWTAAATLFLLCGTLLAADINGTGNASAEAAAKAVDLSRSTASWADFLPQPNQMQPARKITLAYAHSMTDPSVFPNEDKPADRSSDRSSDHASDNTADNTSDSLAPSPARSPLKKQEITFPTIHAGPNTRSMQAENVLFNASLGYLVAVNVADYVSTRQALQYEELYEANPLMKPFAGNDFALAAVKVGLTAGSVFIMKSLYKKNKPLAWAATIVANLAVSYVVVNNLRAIDTVQAQRASICQ